ncbi:histidine--tRNA ligase [Bdellovibrio sp. HCB288]|uniref:histidine--tRNA ligase n=1 Tax=Bdellovibrio sp. HCB288 TaxID=3394355 RepID=UPI0039B416BC
MSKISVLPPSGFRDFTPEESAARNFLIERISEIYLSHGFQAIAMPFLENLATLEGKGGGAGNEKLIFKVLKRGEALTRSLEAGAANLADMGMRFDLTLPLARYYSRFKQQLPKPFKVFQIGPVWRADSPQKGRYREFYQCDVDILGSREIGAEADCMAAILKVFSSLQVENVELHLNDRRLLAALKDSDLSEAQWAEALVTLDKLDKVERAGVEEELTSKFGRVPEGIRLVLDGASLEKLMTIESESVSSLKSLVEVLSAAIPGAKVQFNPSLVRGQDYYTGTIFELRHPDLSGSLGGGGRYNRLLEVFGGEEVPAFGGSIGFERLFLLLQEKAEKLNVTSTPNVFLPLFSAEMRAPLMKLALEMRAAGLRVDIYPDAAKLKNQFKYADDRKIPYTVIIGGDELASGVVKLKSMAERSEEAVPMNELVQRLVQLNRIKL